MVTHGEGKDPFWPVVQKGGEDAARAIGAKFEYIYNPSADMADMASSIQAAAATQPDGMVISLPDPDALGPAIKAAVAAGVPVITMNSGLESSASLGALMHVGQPEKLAGQSAGKRAKSEGVDAEVFGPMAFDNSVSESAAQIKGIKNAVAGKTDILLVPNVEAGNGLVKMMIFFMGACAAGVVVGGKVPVVITSRADDTQARLASMAAAVVAL